MKNMKKCDEVLGWYKSKWGFCTFKLQLFWHQPNIRERGDTKNTLCSLSENFKTIDFIRML